MPVAAVRPAGNPTVSSGSRMTMAGNMRGWKMIFLTFSASCRMTDARPTSEPVPAVVGTATIGAIASELARVQLSPASSKSHKGKLWPAISATALPASNPLPPPRAITPSWPPCRKQVTPAATLLPVGLALMALNTAQSRPALAHADTACWTMGKSASPGSVTSNGAFIPSSLQAAATSGSRPAPTRMAVG